MRTHGRMRERRHIYSPLIYAHVYRFSRSRVCIRFARFLSVCVFSLPKCFDPARKISKKDTLKRKRAPPAIVILLLSFGTFLCDTHTRARVFVSLFDINERAIAFIHSSLARSARARSRFHRSERVAKIILFTPRARPKKSPKLSRLREKVILLFL